MRNICSRLTVLLLTQLPLAAAEHLDAGAFQIAPTHSESAARLHPNLEARKPREQVLRREGEKTVKEELKLAQANPRESTLRRVQARVVQPTKLRDPNIPLAPGEVPDVNPAEAKNAPIDYYAKVIDNPALPRVLLMGDSVSITYSPIVRRELTGLANVYRVPANCGATKTALSDYGLTRWIKEGEAWDVIVFNHGLHDASYRFADGNDKDKDGNYASPARGCKPYVSIQDYEKNLHSIVSTLRRTGAKLVFATTTPIPDSLAEKYVENSEVPYNAVARKVMEEESVLITDLWAAVKPEQQKLQGPRNVHFRDEGSELLGREVAAKIATVLGKGRPL